MKIKVEQIIKFALFATIAAFPFSAAAGYVGMLITLILAVTTGGARQLFNLGWQDKPLLFLIGSFTVAILFSGLLWWSLGVGLFAGCQVGLYLLVRTYLRDNRDIQRAIYIALVASIFVSAYGVYQYYFTDMNAVAQGWVDPKQYKEISSRVFSTLFNPNVLGSYLIFIISTALGCFVYANRQRGLLLGVVISFGVMCLLFTYSRGAWLAMAVSVALFLYWRKEKKYLLGILAVLLAVLIVDFPHLWPRINPWALQFDSSTKFRLEIWKTSWQIFLDHPIWGTGLGTTWYYIPQYSKIIATFVAHSHNMYLQLAVEAGILGFSSFFYFVARVIYRTYHVFRNSASLAQQGIALGLLAGFAGILVQGFVDSALIAPQFGMLFWLFSGISKNLWDCEQLSSLGECPSLERSSGSKGPA